MANVEALRNILEHAEGLDLPEGDYLRVANALRSAFNNAPGRTVRARYVSEKPIELEYNHKGTKYGLTLQRSERIIYADGPNEVTITYMTSTDPPHGGRTTKTHTMSAPFQMIVANWLEYVRPRMVTIRCPALGSFRVEVKVANVKRICARRLKDKLKFMNTSGLPEIVKDRIIEDLSEENGWDYTHFKDHVMICLPSLDEQYNS
jgi:hypothetical protein